MAQATTLLTSSVHEILDDPVVAAHANRLLQSLLQDPSLRKETANAVWGVVRALITLGYFTPGGVRVGDYQGLESTADQARAPTALLKAQAPAPTAACGEASKKEREAAGRPGGGGRGAALFPEGGGGEAEQLRSRFSSSEGDEAPEVPSPAGQPPPQPPVEPPVAPASSASSVEAGAGSGTGSSGGKEGAGGGWIWSPSRLIDFNFRLGRDEKK